MRFADGFLVRSAHKAERSSLLEIDVRRMGERVESWSDLFQFVELREELFLGQFVNGETPFGFVMCVDEVFHRTLSLFVGLTALLAGGIN